MNKSTQSTNISCLDSLKLDALSIVWQLDQAIIDKLDKFVDDHFKYPKGGGWDLESLIDYFLSQNYLSFAERIKTLMLDEITANRRLNFKTTDGIQQITQALKEHYKPNIRKPEDAQNLYQLSQVIYVIAVIRLGVFGQSLDKEALPAFIAKFL